MGISDKTIDEIFGTFHFADIWYTARVSTLHIARVRPKSDILFRKIKQGLRVSNGREKRLQTWGNYRGVKTV